MSETKDASAVSIPKPPMMDVVQVLSLLAFVCIWPLYPSAWSVLPIAIGIGLFLAPFVQVRRTRRRWDHEEWGQDGPGFLITPARRRTLAVLAVPPDVLEVIDESFLGRPFPSEERLREAFCSALGKKRAEEFLELVILHAQIYRKGDFQQSGASPGGPASGKEGEKPPGSSGDGGGKEAQTAAAS